jgi:drug/metabolite transporter (DMT)-like permease
MNGAFLGPLCAFGSSVTWAVGSTFYSQLSRNSSPFAVNFTRALFSLPLFIISAFLISGGLAEGIASYQAVEWSTWGWFTLAMICSDGLGDSLFLWSTEYLGVPGALAIASSFPLWTALGGYFFLGDPLSPMRVFSIVLALVGLIIVILSGPAKHSSNAEKNTRTVIMGASLALLTSFLWAINIFATSRGGAGLLSPVGNTVRMVMAIVLSAIFGSILAPKTALLLSQKQILKSSWVFVFEAFIGSSLFIYGMSHSPLSLGATLGSLAPVISVPVALVLKLEKFSVWRTAGVGVVVLGICLLLRTYG